MQPEGFATSEFTNDVYVFEVVKFFRLTRMKFWLKSTKGNRD
jgi:hypothetical protein